MRDESDRHKLTRRPDRPQRLGQNLGRYAGECIDIDAVLADCTRAAARHGWRLDRIGEESLSLLAFVRPAKTHRTVYISAGIHGDEPAGPLAARDLLDLNQWPEDVSIWLCPCLNPAGFRLNCRGNEAGLDLNRQYRNPEAAEIRAHIAWLEEQPSFDACFCLHEDWEAHGFYLYELNPNRQPSLAEPILKAVEPVCPIDPSELIEGRAAKLGLIRPEVDLTKRPDWPEAFYLITHKTNLSYTLESPSDFPLQTRVDALVTGTLAAVAAPVP